MFISEQCIHWVIIEDDLIPIDTWKKELEPFYSKHVLKLVHYSELILNFRFSSGWVRQQVLKFKISQHIENNSYIILDSKDFFVKSICLKDWPIDEGNGILYATKNELQWESWIETVRRKLSVPIPDIFWAPETPFRFKTSVYNKLSKLINIERLFLKVENPSEFLLYRFLSPETKIKFHRLVYRCFPGDKIPTKEELELEYKNNQILLFSFHKKFIVDCATLFDPIIFWLLEIGFQKNVIMNIKEQYILNLNKKDKNES